MNMNYAKPDKQGKPIYATDTIITDYGIVINPKEQDLLNAGYFPVVDEPPAPEVPEGKMAIKGDPTLYDNAWHNTWEIIDKPLPPPRVFSKLRIMMALKDANVWEQVKQWIEEHGLYDFYLAAQDFSEDNAQFNNGKTAISQLLGWNDQQVEQLLDQCVLEG